MDPRRTSPCCGDCPGVSTFRGWLPPGVGGTTTNSPGSSFLLGFDVPVREGNYNPGTDICDKPRPDTGGYNAENTIRPPETITTDAPEKGKPCQAPSMIVANSVAEVGADYALLIIVQVTDLQ